MKIAVFASGNGSNLQALIDAEKAGELSSGEITLVISDNPGAYALKRAEEAGIPTYVQAPKPGETRVSFDEKVTEVLRKKGIEFIVLAGFMRILSDAFVDEFAGKIMNIHPALLPSFKGACGIKDAFEYGVKITGVTVHFVDNVLDGGPVILQEAVPVLPEDTLESLEEKIHEAEHKLYPLAVRRFVDGKIKLEGRKVFFK